MAGRGSRNAVVALKPALPLATTTIFFLKQERRGGIETKFNFLPRIIPRREAGTPWWH